MVEEFFTVDAPLYQECHEFFQRLNQHIRGASNEHGVTDIDTGTIPEAGYNAQCQAWQQAANQSFASNSAEEFWEAFHKTRDLISAFNKRYFLPRAWNIRASWAEQIIKTPNPRAEEDTSSTSDSGDIQSDSTRDQLPAGEESSSESSAESDIEFDMEEVDVPFDVLQAKEPETERLSASTLIFHHDKLLLCQRAPHGKDDNGNYKENSWAFSWEVAGGSKEIVDKTILSTAVRETKEEVNLHGSRVSSQVYKDSWIHKGVPMTRYTFVMEVREQLTVERRWCDTKQQPVGTNEGPIRLRGDEHLDYCWVTEAQIRHSPPYDENDSRHQRGLAILESKKDIILHAFRERKDSQVDMEGYVWTESMEI
ncbi:uncharacterized protein PGRI_093260 [Penicillium griseofulvum]|uniref:Nudix hydrolase domain-containing protein n=1 Tax=Penicillium patulum TaxID=5078 RepID=A0A135LQR9_PENPA|nr:uncharacterized protein PGRI_093260 [Penicillium griseofulvum]KXG51314.1 hypothetical protein PGRI_093260 [Penicillium griseofulvum]